MELFRSDNTEGYSQEEMDQLNAEWKKIVSNEGLEEYTDEYNQRASHFCDEVARR